MREVPPIFEDAFITRLHAGDKASTVGYRDGGASVGFRFRSRTKR